MEATLSRPIRQPSIIHSNGHLIINPHGQTRIVLNAVGQGADIVVTYRGQEVARNFYVHRRWQPDMTPAVLAGLELAINQGYLAFQPLGGHAKFLNFGRFGYHLCLVHKKGGEHLVSLYPVVRHSLAFEGPAFREATLRTITRWDLILFGTDNLLPFPTAFDAMRHLVDVILNLGALR